MGSSQALRPLTPRERERLFGSFRFVAAPTATNPEGIRILDGWAERNIVRVYVPQLADGAARGTIEGAPRSGLVPWHREGARQLVELFAAWEHAGLMSLVLSWAGSWVPRFVRGSRTVLSNHAWGTAFDINAAWNPLGRAPAAREARGSVRELVPIAHEHGFVWGGDFSRPDGMHFEIGIRGEELYPGELLDAPLPKR